MLKINFWILNTTILLLTLPQASLADCLINSEPVPTGTKSGPYECCEDGRWKTSCFISRSEKSKISIFSNQLSLRLGYFVNNNEFTVIVLPNSTFFIT